jgi:hypothetical protein
MTEPKPNTPLSRAFASPGFSLVSFWLGFMYVAVALCNRGNPLHSDNKVYTDLLIVLCWAVAFHFTSIRSTLRRDTTKQRRGALILWLAAFVGGLHVAYFENAFRLHFSLTAHSLAHAPLHIWIFLGMIIIMALWLAALHIRSAFSEGILKGYLFAFALIPVLIIAVCRVSGPNTYLHIHHYFWAALLVPFARFPNTISTLCCGICCGICVEGASRWGLDPVWILIH